MKNYSSCLLLSFLLFSGFSNAQNLTNITRYEAETAASSVVGNHDVKSSNSGFSGTGYRDYSGEGAIEWDITLADASQVTLTFSYALLWNARPLQLEIDGSVITTLPFTASGGWSTWAEQTYSLFLEAGMHTIRLQTTGSSGPNVDYLDVAITENNHSDATDSDGDGIADENDPFPWRFEAETAATSPIGHHDVKAGNSDFSGTGYRDYNGEGAIEWTATFPAADSITLQFGYALGWGQRPLQLEVDGEIITTLDFEASGGWSIWQEQEYTLSVEAGMHTIRLQTTGASGPNIDYLNLVPVSDDGNPDIIDSDGDGIVDEEDPFPLRFEAEVMAASVIGDHDAKASNSGFSGTGYRDYSGEGAIEWVPTIPEADSITLQFGYALASGQRPLQLEIDGEVIATLDFAASGGWSTWQVQEHTLLLAAGVHRIRLQTTGVSGPNVDYVNIVLNNDDDGDGLVGPDDPYPEDPQNNPSGDWVYCSQEGHGCNLPVSALVRYGVDGAYYFLNVTEFSVMCNNTTFGNPAPSMVKHCDYLISETADYDKDGVVDSIDVFPTDSQESSDTDGDGLGDNIADPFPNDPNNNPGANWVYCASESSTCNLPVPTLVRYGLNGSYYYLNATDFSVTCNNATFGDPIAVTKQCHYLLRDYTDYDGDGIADSIDMDPSDATISVDADSDGIDDSVDPFLNDSSNGELYYWEFCANENDTCHISEAAIVRYGASGDYLYQSTNDSVECTNAVFGDSTAAGKQCEFLLEINIVEFCDAKVNPHELNTTQYREHGHALRLVPHIYATHTALNNGSWFDANTWEEGEVPGADARVVIPEGVTVNYDGISNTRLMTVRVDGTLRFATDTNSKIILDTMFVDPTGSLIIGDEADPIQSHINVDIVIANNGDIDLHWDPALISRGLIVHGTARMHGHEKTVHLKVQNDPLQGDTSLVLTEAPLDWQVGDIIVLAGTLYDGYKWNGSGVSHHDPEDEVLTITSIAGNVVNFDTPLLYDHDSPRADLKTSVANYSRNISIESELGAASSVHHRGHVMFMHNDDVDIRYVEFKELGRTDKSVPARNGFEFGTTITPSSNVKGRYPVHIHRSGLDDLANPAIFLGNAVFSAPGWGYVHHDANAIFHNNASYNIEGAAFVAETGNELGAWTSNIAIATKGTDWGTPKTGANDVHNFDMGRTGSAFYFQGRMIKVRNNIAASANSGFAYFHRGRKDDPVTGLDGMIDFDAGIFDLPEALGLSSIATVDDAPILNFEGNETFASNIGVFVEKSNTNQGHDLRTVFRNFKGWEVVTGAHLAYTAHYLLDGFDVIGKTQTAFSRPYIGIDIGTNASDITVINSRIEDFRYGFHIANGFGLSTVTDIDLKEIYILDPVLINVEQDYKEVNETQQNALSLSTVDIVPDRFNIALHQQPLTYRHTYLAEGSRLIDVGGAKTDSLGTIPIPASIDHNYASLSEVVTVLERSGYYFANGKNYFVLEDYYTDRITGEIHKYGELVELHEDVPLGSPYHSFGNAVYKGEINLASAAPVAIADTAITPMETATIIDLLTNDSDPDADAIVIDGVVQPLNGRVIDNGDGTVTYYPDFDFFGTDTFKYWTTDNFGNYSPAIVTVTVQ